MGTNRREFLQLTAASLVSLPFMGGMKPPVPPETSLLPLGPGGRVPTGFPTLDKALGGGVRRGRIMLIVGGIGTGKTAILRRIAASNNGFVPQTDDLFEQLRLNPSTRGFSYSSLTPVYGDRLPWHWWSEFYHQEHRSPLHEINAHFWAIQTQRSASSASMDGLSATSRFMASHILFLHPENRKVTKVVIRKNREYDPQQIRSFRIAFDKNQVAYEV